MKCIYCGNTKTKIVNSRSTNDSYSTWRRHQCIKCTKLFTTLELPNYDQIFIDKKKLSLSQLSLDIASCFTHNPNFAKDRALWISKIIILELFKENSNITKQKLKEITLLILTRIDPLAAEIYKRKFF
jgi:transcriptional repressor nrdR